MGYLYRCNRLSPLFRNREEEMYEQCMNYHFLWLSLIDDFYDYCRHKAWIHDTIFVTDFCPEQVNASCPKPEKVCRYLASWFLSFRLLFGPVGGCQTCLIFWAVFRTHWFHLSCTSFAMRRMFLCELAVFGTIWKSVILSCLAYDT